MPDAIPEVDIGIEHYVRAAQLAEQGKMDAIFFEDTATVPRSNDLLKGDTYGGISPRAIHLEPMMLLPALAMVTKKLGLVATMSTTFNEPYNVARKFASLDHICNGRSGWNLVTSQNENEAQNFSLETHVEHSVRYERAGEFFDVVAGLWESWDEGAMIRDKESGIYFDLKKMHFLNHKGKFFRVRGPLHVDRAPQGYPVIFQAGSSDPGKELAARTADVVFTAQTNIPASKAFRYDIHERMAKYGRPDGSVKVLPGLTPIVGRTDEEAQELDARMRELIPEDQAIAQLMQNTGGLDLRKFDPNGPFPELPPTNSAKARQAMIVETAKRENLSIVQTARRFAVAAGHLTIVGSPSTVADQMESWLNGEACDGFAIMPAYFPRGVEDFVHLVIPELQRRGIFRTEYSGAHLRDHLGVGRRI